MAITVVNGAVTITTAVAVAAVTPSGGTAPYTYQWYLSSVAGSLGSAISGATASSLTDTALPDNTISYVTCKVTDSTSATATGAQITVDPLVSSVASGTAVVSIGTYNNVTGGTLTNRQSGHTIKYYYDPQTIAEVKTAVSVQIKASGATSGKSFTAPVTLGTDTHGSYATYTTTGFDFIVSDVWAISLAFTFFGGTTATTPSVRVQVS